MSSDESGSRSNKVFDRKNRVTCYCGWEAKFAYGVAVTLAIFEVKRLLMLILEVLAEWQVIRFAGGVRPLILSLADIGLGLPTALTTIRAIRSRKHRDCYSGKRRTLKWLRFVIALCALMNITTLVSVGYHINVKRASLIEIFNTSMHLYMSKASYKYTIDEIQFNFQCCGYISYGDWFLFDWQRIHYTPREELIEQDQLSDEELRDRSVPFSCCNLEVMAPCVHDELSSTEIGTINRNGCVTMLTPVLLRIVIVAYLVTSTLLITQIILAFLVTKITRKVLLPDIRQYNHIHPAPCNHPCMVPFKPNSTVAEKHACSSSLSGCESRERSKRPFRRMMKKIRRTSSRRCIRARNRPGYDFPYSSSDSDLPCVRYPRCSMQEAAKIRPSLQEQHTISKMNLFGKRASH